MRFVAFVVCVVVFLGLCVGAYYIVEDRHDDELYTEVEEIRQEMQDLEATLAEEQQAQVVMWNDAKVVLLTLIPERSEDIKKIFSSIPNESESEEPINQHSDTANLEKEGGE